MRSCGTGCESQTACGQVDRRHQPDSGRSNEKNKTSYFYSYPDPSKYSVKLVSVKEDALYNPACRPFAGWRWTPTAAVWQMNIPDLLPRVTEGDFQRATTTMFARSPHMLPSLGITGTGRKILKHSYIPEELRCTRVDWSELANRCPGSFNVPPEDRPESCSNTKEDCSKDVEFTGYAVRHLRPCITAAWKLPLARYMPLPLQRKTCPEPWCGGSY